jgi:hypothetical protein
MEKFSFFHDSFSITKTSSYFLSLHLESTSFSYVILDTVVKRFVAVKHEPCEENLRDKSYSEKIQAMLKSDAFLNKHYKSVNFGFVTQKSTLIPKPLFDKKYLKEFFTFNQVLADTDELHFNYLKGLDAYNIFAIPGDVTTLMVNRFPEIQFCHHATSFIVGTQQAIALLKLKMPSIHVDINDNFIDIIGVSGGQVVLYNSETFTSIDDILYHCLNVAQQLEMQPSKCYMFVSGDFDLKAQSGKTLKRYFPNLRLAKDNTGAEYHFDKVPEHRLATILNLHTCE